MLAAIRLAFTVAVVIDPEGKMVATITTAVVLTERRRRCESMPALAETVTESLDTFAASAKKIEKGWDVESVSQAAKLEIGKIRKGNGPGWLEFNTFRYMQHVGHLSDIDQGHRSKEDLKDWQRKDPFFSIEPSELS